MGNSELRLIFFLGHLHSDFRKNTKLSTKKILYCSSKTSLWAIVVVSLRLLVSYKV